MPVKEQYEENISALWRQWELTQMSKSTKKKCPKGTFQIYTIQILYYQLWTKIIFYRINHTQKISSIITRGESWEATLKSEHLGFSFWYYFSFPIPLITRWGKKDEEMELFAKKGTKRVANLCQDIREKIDEEKGKNISLDVSNIIIILFKILICIWVR